MSTGDLDSGTTAEALEAVFAPKPKAKAKPKAPAKPAKPVLNTEETED